ncbi:MAG TPA: TonB-dependent receptor [Terriglobales bacterium]|nr:TonB-dependent receptor [Terriglobales bacterium]
MESKTRKRSDALAGLIALAATLLLTTALTAAAQQNTGTILGIVKDSSGAVVPGASILILNEETSLTRTVTTGENGAFRAPALPVGRYTVRVELAGFRPQAQRGLILEVAQELVVSPTLEVGAVTQEEVVVSAEAPLVNITSSALGTVVNERSMSDLPLNGRNYVDLTMLQPGVSQQTLATTGGGATASGTWFSANGAPVRSNNFTLDGAPMTNAAAAATASEAGTTLGVDGIREYKVVTSAFSAEYGMVMGSQTVMVSKNGTNLWHGDVFEYVRNSALDARNFFDYQTTSGSRRLPLFQRNNFGGSFGGPIRKDKTFFYGVYEGLRQNLGVSILDNVLPAACHQLVNRGTNNTTLANPAACAPTLTSSSVVPQVIQPFLDLYPLPNLPGNQFTFPSSSKQREDYGQIRVDHNFSAADTFFSRYNIDDDDLNNATNNIRALASGAAFPGIRTLGTSRSQSATVSEGRVFSPALLNTARLSFSRTNFGTSTLSDTNLVGPRYSLTSGLPVGQIQVSGGITGFQGLMIPGYQIQTVYTLSDDLYYTKERHALKFGMLFNRYHLFTQGTAKLLTGTVTFNDVASFMQGIYDNYAAGTPNALQRRFWSYKTWGFYAQDDMRVTSRLTLNLGLRYEFQTVPRERYHIESRFLNFADPTQTWTYGSVMRNPSFKNFSPRVGFAWDVRGNGKTAIRSGFGLYQDLANFGSALNQIPLGMPPYSRQNIVSSNPQRLPLSIPLQFPDIPIASVCASDLPPADCPNRLQTMAYDLDQPRSLQYNLTVEQQMPLGMGLAVSYVGFRGIHLWQVREGNPIPSTDTINGSPAWLPFLCGGAASAVSCPAPVATVPNPAYHRMNPGYASVILIKTSADSWYNSLQVVLKKRLSRGLEFQSAYTWSKSLDTTQGQSYFADCTDQAELEGTSPLNSRVDKGPSCFDLRHNWHLNLLYHIPNIRSDRFAAKLLHGWWLGNIVTARTGFPFTPLVSVGRSNNAIFAGQGTTGIVDRPNLGTDTTSATFRCSGTASAFPGAPPCSNGSVTYQFVPYDKEKVITGDPNGWFNPLMFRLAPAGFLGNAGRGTLRGPGLSTWDLSLNKDTALPFLESAKLQFRAEIFNILNHANFSIPASIGRAFVGALTDPAGASEAPIPNVGRITTTATSSRQIQVALKVIF